MTTPTNPFSMPVPAEVHLPNAPLERVIAQVRFPEILEIGDGDVVAKFQKAIRGVYPILRPEQIQGIELGPDGLQPIKPKTAWHFTDSEAKWRVVLTSNFLALDTKGYANKADFIARLVAAGKALEEVFDPGQIDRFGMRYIDRLDFEALGDLDKLVIPEVRGIVGSDVADNIVHSIQESNLKVGQDQMMARWGVLPPGATIDPSTYEPKKTKSWFMDVDMFSMAPEPFTAGKLADRANLYSDTIYKLFRWAVTPAFLKRYGGKV